MEKIREEHARLGSEVMAGIREAQQAGQRVWPNNGWGLRAVDGRYEVTTTPYGDRPGTLCAIGAYMLGRPASVNFVRHESTGEAYSIARDAARDLRTTPSVVVGIAHGFDDPGGDKYYEPGYWDGLGINQTEYRAGRQLGSELHHFVTGHDDCL